MTVVRPFHEAADGRSLTIASVPDGTTTLQDLVRYWPAGISVLTPRLRNRSGRRATTVEIGPDCTLEEIAALYGIRLDVLLDDIAEALSRDRRGECVWECRCR